MIRVNIDTSYFGHALKEEKWPIFLPALPRVNDEIISAKKWKDFQLRMKVVFIVWDAPEEGKESVEDWVPRIILDCCLTSLTRDKFLKGYTKMTEENNA